LAREDDCGLCGRGLVDPIPKDSRFDGVHHVQTWSGQSGDKTSSADTDFIFHLAPTKLELVFSTN